MKVLDQKKLQEFQQKVQKLADEEFGRFDADEGSWCEVRLVDRTRGRMPPFDPMPRRSFGTLDEKESYAEVDAAVYNLSVAQAEFESRFQWYRHVRMFERCVVCSNGYTWAKAKESEEGAYQLRSGEWRKSVQCPSCKGKCEVKREE